MMLHSSHKLLRGCTLIRFFLLITITLAYFQDYQWKWIKVRSIGNKSNLTEGLEIFRRFKIPSLMLRKAARWSNKDLKLKQKVKCYQLLAPSLALWHHYIDGFDIDNTFQPKLISSFSGGAYLSKELYDASLGLQANKGTFIN